MIQKLPILKPGDSIEIIAPASRCSDARLAELRELLGSWQLNCIVDHDIFGDDLLCANTDEIRLRLLQQALLREGTKAILCARGGYGCTRLMAGIEHMAPPSALKLFIGISDITALNIFFQQNWQWPTIHAAASPDYFSTESIMALKAILFGEVEQVLFHGLPLNPLAATMGSIEACITGGNLCLVQTSIGTIWQLDGRNKIIFLEDVGERGYRIDRMLEHLKQAAIFKDAAAILLGDFLEGKEPDGSSLLNPVLKRFALQCPIPVVQVAGLGHGKNNMPLLLGTQAKLHLGPEIKLVCSIR